MTKSGLDLEKKLILVSLWRMNLERHGGQENRQFMRLL